MLGLRRLDLYLQHDRPLDEEELVPIRALLRRRAAGEPVAYLVGVREFYGRPFSVSPAVLVPRPETETLVERALAWARGACGRDGAGLRVADVGTGSGCIACTVAAELPAAEVVAADVSRVAAEVAVANAERLGVGNRVTVVVGSWADPLRDLAPFDMLLSNPPYVTTAEMAGLDGAVRGHEPHGALDGGEDGLDAYRELLPGVAPLLRRPAYVGLEVDLRRAGAVAALAAGVWPGAAVGVASDLGGRERVVEVAVGAS